MSDLQIRAENFTTATALVKELAVLLQQSDCNVIVLASPSQWDRILGELEGKELKSRVHIVGLQEEEQCTQEI